MIETLNALLTPTIAVSMALIAYQQWQTNERKRKQDLFDKRFNYYVEMKKIFEGQYNNDYEVMNLDLSDLFIDNTNGDLALFLFGKDIQELIIKLFEQKINTHDEFTKPFEKYLCIEPKHFFKNLLHAKKELM